MTSTTTFDGNLELLKNFPPKPLREVIPRSVSFVRFNCSKLQEELDGTISKEGASSPRVAELTQDMVERVALLAIITEKCKMPLLMGPMVEDWLTRLADILEAKWYEKKHAKLAALKTLTENGPNPEQEAIIADVDVYGAKLAKIRDRCRAIVLSSLDRLERVGDVDALESNIFPAQAAPFPMQIAFKGFIGHYLF